MHFPTFHESDIQPRCIRRIRVPLLLSYSAIQYNPHRQCGYSMHADAVEVEQGTPCHFHVFESLSGTSRKI